MKVGTRVGLPTDFGIVREALVIEDRGDLGVHGEQIVRLLYRIEGADEDFETECRVTVLTEPPTASIVDQLRRRDARRRAERRKAQRTAAV
jgi:hypothetical protein